MAAPAGSTVRTLGLDFPGPVGLAAGFDRDASRIDEVLDWGFGFVELGTVTPQPVPGHNPGAAALAANLVRRGVRECAIGARPVIGVSLGVQPGSPPERAWLDYVHGMQALWPSADYLVLNFTSPSAQGLRAAGFRPALLAVLARAQEEGQRLAAVGGRLVPLLIKWPVRPGGDESLCIAQSIRALGYQGLVAAFDAGTDDAATWQIWVPRACRDIVEELGAQIALVAVGGIDCAWRAIELRRAGARLVQIYRGFVVQGPALAAEIGRGLTAADRAAATAVG